MLLPIENMGVRWEAPEVCRVCKGKCCQNSACSNVPADFENDVRLMESALLSGKFCIDFSRSDTRAFIQTNDGYLTLTPKSILEAGNSSLYIRPRNINRPVVDIIHTKDVEGPCIFWNPENGCELPYDRRPMLGRTLVPVAPGECFEMYDPSATVRKEWAIYTTQLYQLAKRFFQANWPLYRMFRFKL